jgi:cytochrome c peroxidase
MSKSNFISFFLGVGSSALILGAIAFPRLDGGAPGETAPRSVVQRTAAPTQPAAAAQLPTPAPLPEQTLAAAPAALEPAPARTFGYEPIVLENELIEPVPTVAEYFEDYLEMDYVPARIELGQRLFHDPRLSSDNTLSCAGCHDLRYGGVDRAVTATGIRGQIGPINTPTVFNSAFSAAQFWDGRAADLEAQAGGPPLAPGEMGSDWEQIHAKLSADREIQELLVAAFPGETIGQPVEASFWLRAIADFERTLITPDAPFDHYLRGDTEAISELAKEGYQVFKDVGCVECHNGLGIGGKSFQVLGRHKAYFDGREEGVDLGRFNVTGNEEDRNRFKVPTLRNIALTAPYLHDGSQQTLEEVVAVMGRHQLGHELDGEQVRRIVAFLETLTGTWQGLPLDQIQNSVPAAGQVSR